MKRLIILLVMGLAVVGFAAAQASRGGTMYVAIKSVALKSSTGFFASNRGTLSYGSRVTVLQVSGRFVEVRSATNSSLTGWTQTSNLSARQVVAGAGTTATAREVALAGKGFNQEVEASYRTRGTYNYSDVDRVEAISVNESGLRRFLEEGRLVMGD